MMVKESKEFVLKERTTLKQKSMINYGDVTHRTI